MTDYDAKTFKVPPSPWEPIQNRLNAPNRSIKIWESESFQKVVQTERYVKQQQVSSVAKPEMNNSGAAPSKTFFSSNTIIGSAITSGSEPHTKFSSSSSQSTYRTADSISAFISSQAQLSQRINSLTEQSAMATFIPRKTLSQTNITNRTQTVSTNGEMKSNYYWPPESYTKTTHPVPVLSNKDSQQYEKIDRKLPEQLTSATQSSIMLYEREMSSPPQAINYETVISDEQPATDNGNSKSNEITTSDEYKPLQQQTTLALDPPTTSISSYPIKARKYVSKGQSQMEIQETAAAEHSYTNLTEGDGPKSVISQQSARQVVPSDVVPKQFDYNPTVPKAPIKAHTLAESNTDGSNKIVQLSTTSRVESTYVPALLKNDLPQVTNNEMLKSDDVPRTPAAFKEKSSHEGSRNSSIESNGIIQSPTTSEFYAPTTAQPIYSYPLTAQSYSMDELSNHPIIFAGDDNVIFDQYDTGLQYPGVEYEVTLPADQPNYQTIPNSVIESTKLGTEPVKSLVANNNKVVIESNVLLEPPNASLVKSTYAPALPKNPRKNSNQAFRKPTASKAGPMVASNRLNLQSKLPLKSVAGANPTRQSNVDMKSVAFMKQPAVKSQLKLPPRQITAQSATQLSDFDRLQKSRIMKQMQQEHLPHQGPRPLPQQAKSTSTSVSLKRKQKENISPVATFKKPLLQDPNQVKITTLDKSFTLPDISIERIDIVGGIKKKVPVNGMKLRALSEVKSNEKTLTDCMQTLLRNDVQVFKVPLPADKVLARYIRTLEKNNVRVTRLKK